MPLTHYEIVKKKNGEEYFRGSLELPIAVGTKGGVIDKNPLYKLAMSLMNNPTSQELSQILVCVGLAQNFAALRALAI
jgi:degradative hydroxymethylglutaryl-CoA reductase